MAAFAVSCSKENLVEEPQTELANDVIHISANVSFDKTKALDWTASGVTATFGANEYLYVYKDGTFIVRLTNGAGGGSSFEGDIPAASLTDGDNSVTLYYLQDGALDASPDKSVFTGLTYTTQDGTQDGVTEFDLAQGTSTITKSGSTASFAGTITISAQQAILKVTLNDIANDTPVTSFKSLAVSDGTTTYTATLPSESYGNVVYLAIPATVAGKNYTFIATDSADKQYWGYKISAGAFEAAKSYQTTVNLEIYNEKVYVDLGLSKKWANINETASSQIVATYDGTQKSYNGNDHTNWPTQAEYEELINSSNTENVWFTFPNGVKGRIFKSKKSGNNHFIFLPAAGSYGGESAGNYGYYWSGTANGSFNAWRLYFGEGSAPGVDVNYGRNDPYSVRLVQSAAPAAPEGAISGVFSVSADKQVYFSQGNLQAKIATYASDVATASEWKFADNQYDYIGKADGNTSFATESWVDLFSWVGTSADDDKNTYGLITFTTNSQANHGDQTTDALKTDWGTAAASNIGSGWRTLTKDEWLYLFGMEANNTDNTDHARYQKYGRGTVHGVKGIILFPDDYPDSGVPQLATKGTSSTYAGNEISNDDWTLMENSGAVFLPAAGYRDGTSVSVYVGSYGRYWSSTPHESNANFAYSLGFTGSNVNPAENSNRYFGRSVRLVQNVE